MLFSEITGELHHYAPTAFLSPSLSLLRVPFILLPAPPRKLRVVCFSVLLSLCCLFLSYYIKHISLAACLNLSLVASPQFFVVESELLICILPLPPALITVST